MTSEFELPYFEKVKNALILLKLVWGQLIMLQTCFGHQDCRNMFIINHKHVYTQSTEQNQ